jgi:hypothetical protein
MTPAKHTLPVSLTLVRNFLLASMTLVSEAYAVLACFIRVNNTAEEYLTGANDTCNAILHQCQ